MKLISTLGLIIMMSFSHLGFAEPGQGGDREARHSRHMERLIDDLQLSSEQEPAVRQILEEQHTKLKSEMQAVREQAEPRMQALKAETGQRLSSILNEEQLQTFNAKLEDHSQRRQQRRKRWHSNDEGEN
ncbi:MAG: hypothetical protein GKR93_08130 [Gammaproteobacteria bacterium]|nr:hypothetical protein [Gammaproteobacteria bacterium]